MYILIGVGILIADFISKMLVKANFKIGESKDLIEGILSLTYIRNRGMAWGLLENQRWLFIAGTILAVSVMLWYIIKHKKAHFTGKLGISLSVSGALGNLGDRIFYKDGVGDFIGAEFIEFPIFNIADISVCVGVAFLVIYILFFEKNNKPYKTGS